MPTLQWLGRDDALKASGEVPYRVLEADRELGAGGGHENMLIQGDNLEALKALMPYYAGRVKCIYIDPPYNTKSAFEHYDDNLEHATWLSLIFPRLELLRELLSEDGSMWVSIDDNEGQYLKVVIDEIFGRKNFVANVIWEKADSPRMDAQYFSSRHDNTYVYAKKIERFRVNKFIIEDDDIPSHYDKVDDENKPYYLKPLRAMGGQGDSRKSRPTLYYPLISPDGTQVFPKRKDGTDGAWRWKQEKVEKESNRIEWVHGKKGWNPYYRIYAENNGSVRNFVSDR